MIDNKSKKDYHIVIEGHIVRELRCKNDDCRSLIGYENIMLGVFIYNCPKCGDTSTFKMQYKAKAKKMIEKLESQFGEGVKK